MEKARSDSSRSGFSCANLYALLPVLPTPLGEYTYLYLLRSLLWWLPLLKQKMSLPQSTAGAGVWQVRNGYVIRGHT